MLRNQALMMNLDLRVIAPSRGGCLLGRAWSLLLVSLLACGSSKSPELAPGLPPAAAPAANANAPQTQQEADRIKLLEEAQAREKAERKKKRDEMRAMGTGTITKKKQSGRDKNVKIELDFEFKNTSGRELVVAEGALEIRDKAGEMLKSLKVPFPGPIKAGASAKKTGKFPADPGKPGDVTLVKATLKDLQLNWVPQHYRFADGTDLRGE